MRAVLPPGGGPQAPRFTRRRALTRSGPPRVRVLLGPRRSPAGRAPPRDPSAASAWTSRGPAFRRAAGLRRAARAAALRPVRGARRRPGRGRAPARVRARRGLEPLGAARPWRHAPDAGRRARRYRTRCGPVGADELQLRSAGRSRAAPAVRHGPRGRRRDAARRPGGRGAAVPPARGRAGGRGAPTIIPRAAEWGAAAVPPRAPDTIGTVRDGLRAPHGHRERLRRPRTRRRSCSGIASTTGTRTAGTTSATTSSSTSTGRSSRAARAGSTAPVVGAQAQGWNSPVDRRRDARHLRAGSRRRRDGRAGPAGSRGSSRSTASRRRARSTLVSGGGSQNRYPPGAPVDFYRDRRAPRRLHGRLSGQRALRRSSASCAAGRAHRRGSDRRDAAS